MHIGELQQIADEIVRRVNNPGDDDGINLEVDEPYENSGHVDDGIVIDGIFEGSMFSILVTP